jgi:osmotically-inducible protein OsmY
MELPMTRTVLIALLGSSLALGGCAASIAAGVVGAAVRAATPERHFDPNLDLREPATQACRARAAQHGRVQIIDAEQGDRGRATVWGTVEDDRERRSFECVSDGATVRAFRLRAIAPRPPVA